MSVMMKDHGASLLHTEPQLSLNPFQCTETANTIERGVGLFVSLHWFNAHIGHNILYTIYVHVIFYASKAVTTLSGLFV